MDQQWQLALIHGHWATDILLQRDIQDYTFIFYWIYDNQAQNHQTAINGSFLAQHVDCRLTSLAVSSPCFSCQPTAAHWSATRLLSVMMKLSNRMSFDIDHSSSPTAACDTRHVILWHTACHTSSHQVVGSVWVAQMNVMWNQPQATANESRLFVSLSDVLPRQWSLFGEITLHITVADSTSSIQGTSSPTGLLSIWYIWKFLVKVTCARNFPKIGLDWAVFYVPANTV